MSTEDTHKKGFFGKVGDALTSDTAKIIGASTVGAVVGGVIPNLTISPSDFTLPEWLTSTTTIGAGIGGVASGVVAKGVIDASNKRAETLVRQDPEYWQKRYAAEGTGIDVPQRG